MYYANLNAIHDPGKDEDAARQTKGKIGKKNTQLLFTLIKTNQNS